MCVFICMVVLVNIFIIFVITFKLYLSTFDYGSSENRLFCLLETAANSWMWTILLLHHKLLSYICAEIKIIIKIIAIYFIKIKNRLLSYAATPRFYFREWFWDGIIWVWRPSLRLEFSESQFQDQVQDWIYQWDRADFSNIFLLN